MRVELIPFDPEKASREEWERYHRFRRLRHQETEPDDPILGDAAVETLMKREDPFWTSLRYAVFPAGQRLSQLGFLRFTFANADSPDFKENGHFAWVFPEVLTSYRRRGIGRFLLGKAVELARTHSRDLLMAGADEADGIAFMRAIGATIGSRGRESRLVLDEIDWGMARSWVDEGPRRSPDTTLRFYENSVPDTLMEDYSETLTEILNQQPRDRLEIGDEVMTPDRIRHFEGRIVESGGRLITAMTTEADDRISGLTVMGFFPDRETMIQQYITGVRLRYRGRGLGKWLKAAMLLHVREQLPLVRVVVTNNATSNEAMLSINRRLGFRPYKDGIDAQIRLADLEDYLRRDASGVRGMDPV